METLPDYLDTGLRVVSIGLNPSLPSVRDGFYFANPRNRFWRALQASGLLDEILAPGVASMEILLRKYRIGFTDVVKRPTAGARDLRAEDFREWAPRLKQQLLRYQPGLAWFHGKLAYNNFLKYGEGINPVVDWGQQLRGIGATRVFVTPNPSPANAVYSLDDLSRWYRQLGDCLLQPDMH
jgi:TDG/mug DNA glycosylase family protein